MGKTRNGFGIDLKPADFEVTKTGALGAAHSAGSSNRVPLCLTYLPFRKPHIISKNLSNRQDTVLFLTHMVFFFFQRRACHVDLFDILGVNICMAFFYTIEPWHLPDKDIWGPHLHYGAHEVNLSFATALYLV